MSNLNDNNDNWTSDDQKTMNSITKATQSEIALSITSHFFLNFSSFRTVFDERRKLFVLLRNLFLSKLTLERKKKTN